MARNTHPPKDTMHENAQMGMFTPGELPDFRYHALPHTSRSDLNLILRSPQHYRQAKGFGTESTPAMILGQAVHRAVLEPGLGGIVERPADLTRRGKANLEEYEAWMEEHAGQIILSPPDARRVEAIVKAIDQCPAAKSLLLDDTSREYSYLWRDKVTGMACRCRPDAFNPETGIIADLKTTADCTQFGRSIYRYNYFMQAAYYLDGVNNTFEQMGSSCRARAFAFVAIEKTAPFGVLAAVLDEEDIKRGRQAYQRAQKRLAWCLKNDQWPGYSAKVQHVSLPQWARREHDNLYDPKD